MPTLTDYAQLSFFVYNQDVIASANRASLPDGRSGWQDVSGGFDASGWVNSGFGAGVFVKGSEVVISFEGTNPSPLTSDGVKDWLQNNIPLAVGFLGPQAYQAALLFERVKTQYPAYQISFTGHSLGGGLASLMSEYFNKPSTTFAIAPFGLSVNANNLDRLHDFLESQPQHYYDTELEAFRKAAEFQSDFVAFQKLRGRDVQNFAINGEILGIGRALLPYIGNQPIQFNVGNTELSNLDRHSMLLHLAAQVSDSFDRASIQLPTLLPLIFRQDLYGRNLTQSTDLDFLNRLVRYQLGGAIFNLWIC